MEIYKPIPLPIYENYYSVSNFGDIKSLRSGKILKKTKSKAGYYRVSLSVGGVYKKMSVARLVALAFIPNPNGKPTVNHINEVKTDNRVENLEWATNAEQNAHGTRTQRAREHTNYKARKIDYSVVAKKHDYEKIAQINRKPIKQLDINGNVVNIFASIKEAAQSTHIRNSKISWCAKGNRNSAGGFKWQYIN